MRSVDVCLSKGKRIAKRVIDVGLSSEMKNRINFFFTKNVAHEIRRSDISLDELKVGQILEFLQVGKAGAVVKLVIHNNFVLRVLFAEKDRNVGGDKA